MGMIMFDVMLEDDTRVGSMEAIALPIPGDVVRVDEPGRQPEYAVLRRFFEPDRVTVIVRPVGDISEAESAPSPFYGQQPGAGGFT